MRALYSRKGGQQVGRVPTPVIDPHHRSPACDTAGLPLIPSGWKSTPKRDRQGYTTSRRHTTGTCRLTAAWRKGTGGRLMPRLSFSRLALYPALSTGGRNLYPYTIGPSSPPPWILRVTISTGIPIRI